MGCKFKCTIAFLIGATTGSLTVWKLLKTKYERIAQEEIDSVKEVFSKRKINDESVEQEAEVEKTEEPNNVMREYYEYSTSYGNEKQQEEKKEPMARPYVISPSEFGEFDDYERISFTYYADHVLTDEDDDLVEDIEGSVGFDSLNHFGEYEDDSVHVRNDRLKCDYEILRDNRRYSDVINKKPHLMED
jgi:hypothetical protein